MALDRRTLVTHVVLLLFHVLVFPDDGFEPIGIYVKKCTASNDAQAGTPGIAADTPVTFIEDG